VSATDSEISSIDYVAHHLNRSGDIQTLCETTSDGHGSARVLYDLAQAADELIPQLLTFAAHGGTLAVHDSQGTIQATIAVLTSLGYSGEFFDAATQQQYLRARFYNPANGRFNRLDPFAGNMQDPQSLHKYAYVHGDPIQGIDPSGNMTVSLGSLSVSFSIGTYITGTVASYAIGKGFSAAYLLALDGDLHRFQWLEPIDLFSLIPGGVFAGVFAKVTRYPVAYLVRSGSHVVGTAPPVVGKLFAQGINATRLASQFARRFPSGWNRWIPGVNGGVTWRLSNTRFAHLMERHLPQFYNGSRQAAHQTTGFWPFQTTPDDVLAWSSEAMYKMPPPRSVPPGVFVEGDILLSNGILTRLVIKDGELITFFPKSGPGVTTVQEILAKGRI
jgi:RHS repeat-associated protein